MKPYALDCGPVTLRTFVASLGYRKWLAERHLLAFLLLVPTLTELLETGTLPTTARQLLTVLEEDRAAALVATSVGLRPPYVTTKATSAFSSCLSRVFHLDCR